MHGLNLESNLEGGIGVPDLLTSASSFYFGLYFSRIFSVQVLYTFHQIYSQYLILFMLFNMVLLFHFPFF